MFKIVYLQLPSSCLPIGPTQGDLLVSIRKPKINPPKVRYDLYMQAENQFFWIETMECFHGLTDHSALGGSAGNNLKS